MSANKQKTAAAINRLSKALQGCSELGLKMAPMHPQQIVVGDHVLHGGVLKKVVARSPQQPTQVAFEDGVILDLPAQDHLVLRG